MPNQFYTAEPIWKTVSEEEYKAFLENYPRKLRFDVYAVCDPPSCTYNDFKLANRWPYSIVASHTGGEPNEHYGWDYVRTYKICVNFQELFDSKTGYLAGAL